MIAISKLNTPDCAKNQISSKVISVEFYRGVTSIDQEMEREIAMQRFFHSEKIIFTQKSFLLRDRS